MNENDQQPISDEAVGWWERRDQERKAKKGKKRARYDRFDDYDLWGEYVPGDYSGGEWNGAYGNWGAYTSKGFRQLGPQRVGHAQKMMKSFVNTFSRADEQYAVVFNEVATASSDRQHKQVKITSEPLFDTDLSDEECARVLTGFACHEAGHSRYGTDHEEQMRATFGLGVTTPHALSNLLDDVYLEAAFVAEYPGYAGVFDDAMQWVKKQHKPATREPSADALMRGVGAVRYADMFDWDGANAAELAWWQAWATKHGVADTATHLEGIRLALEHIAEEREQAAAQQGQPQPGEGQPGSGEGQKGEGQGQQGQPGEGQPGQGQAGKPEGKPESGRALAKRAEEGANASDLGVGLGMSELGTAGDVEATTTTEQMAQQAQDMMTELATLEQAGDVAGSYIEHNRNARLLPKRRFSETGSAGGGKLMRRKIDRTGTAAAAIRAAFMRTRGGHSDVAHGQTRGRCDNRSLYRIAMNDSKMFHRRNSPSPDNWLVWVLVDWSTSMKEAASGTLSTAHALASASNSVPQMRMAVKLWTTNQTSKVAGGSVTDLWANGESLERLVDHEHVKMGGTPDAKVMAWARKAILRELRSNERAMIVMVSDGVGKPDLMVEEVAAARKAGIEVLSVAAGPAMKTETQDKIYGPKRYVAWAGSVARTAAPLAKMLARYMGG